MLWNAIATACKLLSALAAHAWLKVAFFMALFSLLCWCTRMFLRAILPDRYPGCETSTGQAIAGSS